MPEKFETVQSEINAILDNARMKGYWFTHKRFGSWITPDEFEALCDYDMMGYKSKRPIALEDYEEADPRQAILSSIQRVNKDLLALSKFVHRVFDYSYLSEKDEHSRKKAIIKINRR